MQHIGKEELQTVIDESRRLMNEAAKRLDFLQAAQYRDEIIRLTEQHERQTKE